MRSIVYDDEREIPDNIRTGMMGSRERVEAKYGRDELWKAIGPGHEEAWQYGYISGKLVPRQATFAPLIKPGLMVAGGGVVDAREWSCV